uniref:Late endosomal/lysosomal adaptor and MAPK and MTOR activator 5 n=1 Tax=Pyrodinium bahamense TaxID=73915 RepID=A0A7S0ALP1_9DINO|mmetsp:Transcript_3742/g.10335  ORF Transcript_3742/g.10335 Transcript_3742/m.10335 type:complete len:113 (+) Transcript_3742:77-415(+)
MKAFQPPSRQAQQQEPQQNAQPHPVAEVLDSLLVDGAKGIMCLDSQGFVIGSRGDLLPQRASHIARVAQCSAQLQPDAKQAPMITIETNKRTLTISSKEDVVVAMSRDASQP